MVTHSVDCKFVFLVLLPFLFPTFIKRQNKGGLRFKGKPELNTDEQRQPKTFSELFHNMILSLQNKTSITALFSILFISI